jgi:hypothetical protein
MRANEGVRSNGSLYTYDVPVTINTWQQTRHTEINNKYKSPKPFNHAKHRINLQAFKNSPSASTSSPGDKLKPTILVLPLSWGINLLLLLQLLSL